MISPEEIKRHALKWWQALLQSTIKGEAFFPRTIERIGKVQSGDITERFEVLQKEIELLYRQSKAHTGLGYIVNTTDRNFRRTGSHQLPDSILFETVEDYLSFVGKKKEWNTFNKNYQKITETIPRLKDWTVEHSLLLADPLIDWNGIMKVCQYFIDNPRPDLYIRQLPIAVHTKFIEENRAAIQSLLDFLIPEHIRDEQQKRFAERYFLRYDELLVRIRFLDPKQTYFPNFSDISIPLSSFEKIELPAINVLITENKMNFLTLPELPSTIAVWTGGGFGVSNLREVHWLGRKKIYYWGDIDEHGFQILHQVKGYYPHARSVMMDKATFDAFFDLAGKGERNRSEHLSSLSDEEMELYNHLKSLEFNRFEQEKIPQAYVDEYLSKVIK